MPTCNRAYASLTGIWQHLRVSTDPVQLVWQWARLMIEKDQKLFGESLTEKEALLICDGAIERSMAGCGATSHEDLTCGYCGIRVAVAAACGENESVMPASKERVFSELSYGNPKQIVIVVCVPCNYMSGSAKPSSYLRLLEAIKSASEEPPAADNSPLTEIEALAVAKQARAHKMDCGRICAVTGVRGLWHSGTVFTLSFDRLAPPHILDGMVGSRNQREAHTRDITRVTLAGVNIVFGMLQVRDPEKLFSRWCKRVCRGDFHNGWFWNMSAEPRVFSGLPGSQALALAKTTHPILESRRTYNGRQFRNSTLLRATASEIASMPVDLLFDYVEPISAPSPYDIATSNAVFVDTQADIEQWLVDTYTKGPPLVSIIPKRDVFSAYVERCALERSQPVGERFFGTVFVRTFDLVQHRSSRSYLWGVECYSGVQKIENPIAHDHQDMVVAWIRATFELAANVRLYLKPTYTLYKERCAERQLVPAGTINIGRWMRRAYPEVKLTGQNSDRFWSGLRPKDGSALVGPGPPPTHKYGGQNGVKKWAADNMEPATTDVEIQDLYDVYCSDVARDYMKPYGNLSAFTVLACKVLPMMERVRKRSKAAKGHLAHFQNMRLKPRLAVTMQSQPNMPGGGSQSAADGMQNGDGHGLVEPMLAQSDVDDDEGDDGGSVRNHAGAMLYRPDMHVTVEEEEPGMDEGSVCVFAAPMQVDTHSGGGAVSDDDDVDRMLMGIRADWKTHTGGGVVESDDDDADRMSPHHCFPRKKPLRTTRCTDQKEGKIKDEH
ncbi:hypothetical protein HDU87_004257 [Geranomyces variabilis]|uniref:Uncharacterized protein n=1 Tax=Geranomyces variabilis TaxID=109894 RepID=A0AAD5XQT2_9FUNG|nr:hypothetical protein HDU87_004257 [Geranomyces variabilis]